MKELIKHALDEAYEKALKSASTQKTKKEYKYIEIKDVKPLELSNFMKENNIPDNVYFSTDNNHNGIVCLCYEVEVNQSDSDKELMTKLIFNALYFGIIHKVMTSNSYTLQGAVLSKYFHFDYVYNLYMDKNFNELVKYFTVYFEKKEG